MNTIASLKKKHHKPETVIPKHIQGNSYLTHIKQGIWLYFWLLIFEGALRKWFLPGLATPLLVVRDPVALYILLLALKNRLLPINGYVVSILLVSGISFITTLLFGHQNLMVAIYGLRIFILHFPLMFVIGRVFTRRDILKMGQLTLYISLPMIVLLALQFYSPQSAWVNRGLAGDTEGAGFQGAMGYFRPPGTFSFTSGNSQFWGFDAIFVVYGWLSSWKINRYLLIAATGALLMAIPFSISRGLFFEVGITLFFSLVVMMRKPGSSGRLIPATMVILLLLVILSGTSFFRTGVAAFTERFTTANESEGGLHGVLIDRFLGGMVGAITNSYRFPFWGEGLGMGTNVGSMLLTGKRTFLISEGEWGRLIGEMGVLTGLSVILIRTILAMDIFRKAFLRLSQGDFLPWLLVSFGFLVVLQGQWAQPTSLGFSTLTGGLMLAAVKPGYRKRKRPEQGINNEIARNTPE